MENNSIDIIHRLREKYESENNTYALSRIDHHLNLLPSIIESEIKKNNDRICKFNELTNEQDAFTTLFLNQHKFFYTPYNNKYYEYDGKKYYIIEEDLIQYKLLSSITNNQILFQWKYKTKINIIKKIKNISLLSSIPETYTIQNILSFLQMIFVSTEESIHFLCVLGDCILKKNNDLLYFIKPNAKHFISAIDYIIYTTFGYSIANNFILKYHLSHDMEKYRLIKTKTISSVELLKNTINEIGLDLICVATYYSDFYKNSENYISSQIDDSISNYILYFVKNTPDQIVDTFIENYIEISTDPTNTNTNNISWKNMHYIWKLYLHTEKIPTFMYTPILKNYFLGSLSHEISTTGEIYFKGITSKYLPNISSFLSFWNDTMIIIENTTNNFNYNVSDEINSFSDGDIDYDYEISEILQLYKNSLYKTGYLNYKNLLRILHHYFCPNIQIIDDKYIKGIECKLWNKKDEIQSFLQSYKYNMPKNIYVIDDYISIDKLYDYYKKNVANKNLTICKDYFQKYVSSQLQDYIIHDNLIDSKWFES
jgi:hypothetical protein